MDGILDDSRLNGVNDVGTALRPLRQAELLPIGDLDAFYRRVEHACQVWGGSGTVLVPSSDGTLAEPYLSELIRSDVDSLETKHIGEDVKAPSWIDHGMVRPYSVLLIAQGMKERADWHPFRVAELGADDPWKPIYAATVGLWPAVPSPELFPHPFYDAPPESFELFFKVERSSVTGSLDDLIDRLTGSNSNRPRLLSLLGLAAGVGPNTSYIAAERALPEPNETRWAAGPNIIVVFGDDPVADAALLWNLRGVHAGRYALPIGLPKVEVTAQTLARLRQPGLFAAFGLSGGQTFITSASVSVDELEAFACLQLGHVAAPMEKLLQFGQAPAIPRNELATFSDGVARLAPESETDIKLIYPHGREGIGPELQLDVVVDNHPVPASKTMRGDRYGGPRFAAGHAHLQVPSSTTRMSRSVRLEWPTPWLRLQCVARDRGLEVEASVSGHAALALMNALGGIHQIQWLTHPGLVRLLYKLAERSGMTWWKNRWNNAQKAIVGLGVGKEAIEDLADRLGRDEPAIAPAGEGRELRYQELVNALGGKEKAAGNWIRWAEGRRLVVRGAQVRCDKCRARSWIPMSALPPTIVCPGCGRPIDHPFPPRQLEFTYRLGEVLRRALEVDCLDHLFALRYFHELLGGRLVGLHPGVNFKKKGTSAVCGEADVLMLFPDGSLVPGEVKRTGAGVTPEEVAKLDALAGLLEAPWSFFAVGQAARECGENVPAAAERDRAQPRLVITADQTYHEHIIYGLGADPFAWNPVSEDAESKRSERFVSYLRDRAPDDPWSSQDSMLLTSRDDADESES